MDLDEIDFSPEGVRKIRENMGMNKKKFADALQMDDVAVSRWERGMVKPSLTSKRQIKRLLDAQQPKPISKPAQSPPSFRMVDPDNVTTLEEYAAAIVGALISLKTLHKFCDVGLSQGFLEQDEMETATTIAWETRRLREIYHRHLEEILDRTNLTKADILASLANIESGVQKNANKARTYSRS